MASDNKSDNEGKHVSSIPNTDGTEEEQTISIDDQLDNGTEEKTTTTMSADVEDGIDLPNINGSEENVYQDDQRQTVISPTPKQIKSFLPDIKPKDKPKNNIQSYPQPSKNRKKSIVGRSTTNYAARDRRHTVKVLEDIPARQTASGNLITSSSSGTLIKITTSGTQTAIAKATRGTVEFNNGVPYGVPHSQSSQCYVQPYSIPPRAFSASSSKSSRYNFYHPFGADISMAEDPDDSDGSETSGVSRGVGAGRGSGKQLSFARGRGRGRGRGRTAPMFSGLDDAKPLGPHTMDHLPESQELAEQIEEYITKFALKKIDIPRLHVVPGPPDNYVTVYLARHGIQDLFQLLTTSLVVRRPDDPLDYLINFTGDLGRTMQKANEVDASTHRPPLAPLAPPTPLAPPKGIDSLLFRTAANASATSYLCCDCSANPAFDIRLL